MCGCAQKRAERLAAREARIQEKQAARKAAAEQQLKTQADQK